MELGENQKKFVQALRDPNNKQCFGRLGMGECRCAIGLAAEVLGIPKVINQRGVVAFDGYVINIPATLPALLGATRGYLRIIMDMNDIDHLPFPKIADRIEKAPERFFYATR